MKGLEPLKKSTDNKGFIIVIVIFLITFILGGIFLNYKLTSNKGARLKGRIDGFHIKNEIENINSIVYYEMTEIRKKLSTHEYSEIIEHFSKNSNLDRVWQNDSPEKSKESFGKYTIDRIILGKSEEIYQENSYEFPLEAIKKVIGKNAVKITIVLKKKIAITSASYNKTLTFCPEILLTYNKGNKDVFSPNSEIIEKIEVFEDE